MSFFNWFGNKASINASPSNRQSGISTAENYQINYQEAKNLYLTNWAAKATVDVPIKMLMHQEKIITAPDIPQEAIDAFLKMWDKKHADDALRRIMASTMIYGASSLLIVADNWDPNLPATRQDLANRHWVFNVADPLAAQQFQVNQDPNSANFQRAVTIQVGGKTYAKTRSVLAIYGDPLYIYFSSSTFAFSGLSVYQGVQDILHTLQSMILTYGRIAAQCGTGIYKREMQGAMPSAQDQIAAQISSERISSASSFETITIGRNEDIYNLNFQGSAESLSQNRESLLESLAAGVSLPKEIYGDRKFATQMGEGEADKEVFYNNLAAIRHKFTNVLELMIYAVQCAAWTDEFIDELRSNGEISYESDNIGNVAVFKDWRAGFVLGFENKHHEDAKLISEAKKMDTDRIISIAQATNASKEWLIDELSSAGCIDNEIILDLPNGESTESTDLF